MGQTYLTHFEMEIEMHKTKRPNQTNLKSLTDKAYSWFINLLANSIKDWDELVNAFCTKFFIAAPKVEIVDLSKDSQRKNKSPSSYVLRFKEKDPRYCAYHRTLNHSTSDCYVITVTYHNKVQKGGIM